MRHAWYRVGLGFMTLACRTSPPERHPPSAPDALPPAKVQSPDTTPPANVSHGEAPVGGTNAPPAPIEPRLPPLERGRLHRLRLEIKHVTVTVAPGITYAAWTFNGGVPGPVLHVRQGDTVDFTLINQANTPHSMDFHAAEIAPSKYYVNVMPGDSLHYRFVARVPGAFMYHCGTAPAAIHIANGMYGALVVDPATPRPRAKEFVLVQSEFYFTPKTGADGAYTLNWPKLLDMAPDHVVFNGRASQYAEHPIDVSAGELVRLYVVNAGPNRISSFHVVGRDLRAGVRGRVAVQSPDRRADGERPRGRRRHLRGAPPGAGRLSLRHPCLRGRHQGRHRGTARGSGVRPGDEDALARAPPDPVAHPGGHALPGGRAGTRHHHAGALRGAAPGDPSRLARLSPPAGGGMAHPAHLRRGLLDVPQIFRRAAWGSERLGWAALVLLNAGLLLRAVAEPWHAVTGHGGTALVVSAVFQMLAGLAFVANTWPRIRER